MWQRTVRILVAGWLMGSVWLGMAQAENRALFIGIDDYQSPDIHKLRGAVYDARQMQQFAQRVWGYRPEQTRLLLDREATRAGILEAMRTWLIEGTTAGDQVLFYYSGHGFYTPDTNGDEDDGLDETLVPTDVYMQAGTFHNMVIDDEIQILLDQINDRQVTVIIDSCHSGTVTRAVDLDACRKATWKKRPTLGCRTTDDVALTRALLVQRHERGFVPSTARRVVWSAVSATQEAFEEREAPVPGGVFTSRFIAGVEQMQADANHNGQVTHAELLDYLQRESERYCQQHAQECPRGLTPTLEAPPPVLAQNLNRVQLLAPQPAPSLAETATELLAHAEEQQVRLEVLPATHVRLGTLVQFRVTSPVAGHLLVLDTNPAGELVQIFPNAMSGPTNRIAAHRPLDLHVAFKATDPGPGLLLAVVTVDPVDLSALVAPSNSTTRDLQVIPNPNVYLLHLATQLRQTWTQDTVNRRTRWVLGQVNYVITQ